FARIIYYTDIYNTLFFPLLPRTFEEKSKRLVTIMMVALFALYMYFLLPRDSNMIPYKDIFGHVFY
ncbi:MAG: hypothetical protein LIP01_03735, partial [Tannerellaceae bacterium]|nr:hypothetical protein [Tannerellaceae bacterium]